MVEISPTDALAALKAALDGGAVLAPEDARILADLQAATAPLPDELVIQLRKPVAVGSGEKALTFGELVLREPTAAEMATWDKLTGTDADIQAVSIVSGLPKSAVEKLGARDLMQAARYIGRFFG